MPTTDERLKQIEIVALKEEGDLPENMSMSENMFYEEMHCLYARYKMSCLASKLPADIQNKVPIVTKDEASALKQKYLAGVRNMQMWEDIFKTEIHIANEINKVISPTSELNGMTKEQLLDKTIRMIGVIQGLMNADDRIPKFLEGLRGENKK